MNQIAPSTQFDAAAADAFQRRLVDVLNGSAVALMLSVGHRTGLFDAMAGMPPATSAEIARAAGLDERYVREWLAVMVTGGVIVFDPEQRRYRLPARACREPDARRPARQPGGLCPHDGHGAVKPRLLRAFRTG